MPRDQRTITAADILPLDQYETIRKDKKEEAIQRKKLTRMAVGPYATILFETWDSMWLQIQEMLRIEKGGEEQLADELAAYDPMVPKGNELTATLLFEIDDEVRRDAFLRSIGGIEQHIALDVAGTRIPARPEGDVERTRASDGKASSVHFVHFDLPPESVEAWRKGDGQVMVVIDHPNYGHAALVNAESRDYLGRECL
ncbi:MAG: DUF3501 family protein [Caenibius sp.]